MTVAKFYPSSYTTNLSKGTFTSPENAYADDGLYADFYSDQRNDTNRITYSGFDFSSIPSGSVINSVSIEVELYYVNTGVTDYLRLQALKNGVDVGTPVDYNSEPTSDYVFSNSNTGSWTLSELPTISIWLEHDRPNTKTATDIYIDYFAVVVDYTPPATITGTVLSSKSFTVTVNGEVITEGNVNASKYFSTTVIGEVLSEGSVVSSRNFITSVNGYKIVFGSTISDNNFVSSVLGEVIKEGNILSENVSSTNVLGEAITEGIVNSISNFTSIVSGEVITEGSVISVHSFTVSVDGYKEVFGNVNSVNSIVSSAIGEAIKEISIISSNNYMSSVTGEVLTEGTVTSSRVFAYNISGEVIAEGSILSNRVFNVVITSVLTHYEKLMTMDSALNLKVKDEIIEGSAINLDKNGVLTVVEIIEGSDFNLDSTGTLTVNSVLEGGI